MTVIKKGEDVSKKYFEKGIQKGHLCNQGPDHEVQSCSMALRSFPCNCSYRF